MNEALAGGFDRQAWMANWATKKCACGRADIVRRWGTDFVCERCARLEAQYQNIVVVKAAPVVVEVVEVARPAKKLPGFGALEWLESRMAGMGQG